MLWRKTGAGGGAGRILFGRRNAKKAMGGTTEATDSVEESLALGENYNNNDILPEINEPVALLQKCKTPIRIPARRGWLVDLLFSDPVFLQLAVDGGHVHSRFRGGGLDVAGMLAQQPGQIFGLETAQGGLIVGLV